MTNRFNKHDFIENQAKLELPQGPRYLSEINAS
jgi:hypothetical protein